MRRVIILGSTGSIGKSTLAIIRKDRKRFKVIGLSAYSNIKTLRKQIEEFKPEYAVIQDEAKAESLKRQNRNCKVFKCEKGLLDLASKKSDIVVCGITGLAALKPLLKCIGRTKRILLANKEAIVAAAHILKERIDKSSTDVIPVDSEAWAVYMLLKNVEKKDLKNVYITASGGPFLSKSTADLHKVTPEKTLAHPVWKMGQRITVDSANLMNKGFEVIEVHNFFDIPLAKIKVLVHPESAVHAMIETKQGVLFSSMFAADMKVPIGYGLYLPEKAGFNKELDLLKVSRLEFFKPDTNKFPALKLAYKAARKQGNLPVILTSADEEAVNLFLKKKISFLDICSVVEKAVKKAKFTKVESLEDIFFWDSWAKKQVRSLAG